MMSRIDDRDTTRGHIDMPGQPGAVRHLNSDRRKQNSPAAIVILRPGASQPQVERFFPIITGKAIRRGSFASVKGVGRQDRALRRSLQPELQTLHLDRKPPMPSGFMTSAAMFRWRCMRRSAS